MSSEPLATTAAPATDTAASAERGLLIVLVVMVLLGTAAMVMMS
jgi:hypothetical protein